MAAKQLFDADAAGIMLADMEGKLCWASASDQRAQVLEDNQEVFAAGPCSEAFTTGRPAVMHDATMERRWGEIALTFVEVQIRSGLSVPVGWAAADRHPRSVRGQPAGLGRHRNHRRTGLRRDRASLLLAGAKAELSGALADQLQTALDSRGLIERAKGALMEREHLDDQRPSPTYAEPPAPQDASCRRWPARSPPGSPAKGADQTDHHLDRAGRRRSGTAQSDA